MQNDQPDIIIIQADQPAAGASAAYDNSVTKTPHVDAPDPPCLRASKIYSELAYQDTFGFRAAEQNDG